MNDTAPPLSPEALLEDVADILEIDAAEIDIEADLFEMGLDSLRLHSLIARWREDGVQTGYMALAAEPTIADWTRMLCPLR